MSFYLTSTDAEVIATVDRNEASYPEFRERAHAWATERGSEAPFISRFTGVTKVTGLMGAPTGFGRWTKPDHRGKSAPFANNKAEMEIMRGLRHAADPIPGLPQGIYSLHSVNAALYFMSPIAFVVDGVAWAAYAHQPDPSEMHKFGPQWTECLASRFHAADEARRGVA